MSNAVLELRGVTRSFPQGGQVLDVLRGVDLTLKRGEVVALVGASGSGKSTLLQIAGLLDTPTNGEIIIEGITASRANDDERTQLRRKYLGFVYQYHHLLPEFTACENVALPQMIAGVSATEAEKRAQELLAGLGLAARASHRPGALSGGEQQRVAIARALANDPSLILADEPTGNLDPDTAESVFALFVAQAKSRGAGGHAQPRSVAAHGQGHRVDPWKNIMELILVFARLATVLIVDPVWWFCGWVASFFYPEYSHEYLGVAWFVCLCLVFSAIFIIMIFVV